MLGVAPLAAAPFASLAGGDKTVALEGIAASGAVGSITSVEVSADLSGVYAQVLNGNVAIDASIDLAGVEAAGIAGSVFYSQEISGVEATGGAGNLAIEAEYFLDGVLGTGAVTQTFPETEIAIAGVEAVGEVGDPVATQVLDGVELIGEAGDIAAVDMVVDLSGVATTVEQGEMIATQILDGVELLGEVGTLGIGDRELELTGVETFGEVGDISYSQGIQPDVAYGETGTAYPESEVAITGVQASINTSDVIPGFEVPGVEAIGQVGSIAATSRTIALSGVSATAAVGTVIYARSEAITGNQATGSVGTVEFSYVADGQVAYGQVGYMLPVHTVALLEGWGALGWGVEPWGGNPETNVITGSVGDVVGGQLLGPGVSATGGVGSMVPGVIPYPEGDVAYGQVGTPGNVHEVALNTNDVLGWGLGPWSGDTSTGGFYDIEWGGQYVNNPSVGHGQTGTLVATPLIPLAGVEATGQVGTLGVAHDSELTGVEAAGEAGTVYPVFYVGITGVYATGYVGTMGVIHINALTGVEALGIVGNVCVGNWTTIDTS